MRKIAAFIYSDVDIYTLDCNKKDQCLKVDFHVYRAEM